MMNSHDPFLDDVAVYALGALPPAEEGRVRAHLRGCAECRAEYALLNPAVTAVAYDAEACKTGENGPQVSSLLKARIMREVRASASSTTRAAESARTADPARARRPIVWPAYLVAAACFAFALISTTSNILLMGELRQTQTQLATTQDRVDATARRLANEHVMLADLMSTDAKRYATNDGEIVAHGDRLYIAMHDMPMPPRGKVYQAWTMPKGGKAVVPSVTFMPDRQGVAMVALPENASAVTMVAVSVEPDGGSKAPTSKPIAVVPLN
jgi:hypothetical protein